MKTISIVIPTVPGREEYAKRCEQGYRATTGGYNVELIWIYDDPTCGLAWRKGGGLARGNYVHLTADDIVPMPGWADPLVEACDQGKVPCPIVVTPTPDLLDAELMPRADVEPPADQRFFFERRPSDESAVPDWYLCTAESEYPAVPFLTLEQWIKIGTISSWYGTDKWIGWKARQLGMPVVARHGSRFFHYAATAGRVDPANGWMHIDRLDFDLNIAWPEYTSGRLAPHERHPLDLTREGRELARQWRRRNLPGPYPWEIEPNPAYK